MKIVWRCEDTENGLLVEGACIVGDKKFGSVEVIPNDDFTAAKMQTILNQISVDIAGMLKGDV